MFPTSSTDRAGEGNLYPEVTESCNVLLHVDVEASTANQINKSKLV